ncbi:MAG: DUF362 domain-containing protein [Flavobacteriales bacterium]|nr:DUF362 domain-containing protein [Flavobacteriales bacterium]
MKRREFLKATSLGALASIFSLSGLKKAMASTSTPTAVTSKKNSLVAVMGGTPPEMFEKAIASLGGMEKYIKKGQKVVIKPNIAWDKTPDLAANTNPELVGAVVKKCLAAGAKEVVVFDHTCDNWKSSYAHSGIEKAATAAGARVVPADLESYYQEVTLPKAKNLKNPKIHKALIDCDVWINMPILKNHGGAKMSISMKNFMGIVWDREYFHSNDLQQCIADITTWEKRPVLNIIDAYRIMFQNGPRGKSEGDTAVIKSLIISSDMVAADTAAISLFNKVKTMSIDMVGHIKKAESLGVGTTDLKKLNITQLKM